MASLAEAPGAGKEHAFLLSVFLMISNERWVITPCSRPIPEGKML